MTLIYRIYRKYLESLHECWNLYTLDQTITKVEKGCRRLLSRYKKYS